MKTQRECKYVRRCEIGNSNSQTCRCEYEMCGLYQRREEANIQVNRITVKGGRE